MLLRRALRYPLRPGCSGGCACHCPAGKGDSAQYAFIFVALFHAAGIPARPVLRVDHGAFFRTPHGLGRSLGRARAGFRSIRTRAEGGHFRPALECPAGQRRISAGWIPIASCCPGIPGSPGPVRSLTFSDAGSENTLALEGLGDWRSGREAPSSGNGPPVKVPFSCNCPGGSHPAAPGTDDSSAPGCSGLLRSGGSF